MHQDQLVSLQGKVEFVNNYSVRRIEVDVVGLGFTPDYCNLVQDSDGYLWVFTREDQQGTAHRSSRPNAIDTWEPESICLPVKGRHALDAAALENGMLYVVSLLTTDGKLYGNLYDGRELGRQSGLDR